MVKAYCLPERFGNDSGYCHHDGLWDRLLSRFQVWHQTVVNSGFFFVGVASGFYMVFKEVFKEVRREEKGSSGHEGD